MVRFLRYVRGRLGGLSGSFAAALALLIVSVSSSFAQAPAPDFTSHITDAVTTLGTQLGIVIGAVVVLGAALMAFRAGWKQLRKMAG